ncbi:MAG: hypothetical protein QGG36_25760 [Pirellulaceae bacterium]|nr:hypothetical protein [Pirellulaceae bacterium]
MSRPSDTMRRIVVVGSSCAGKTTFAAQLADRLSSPFVQLDELHWGPDWTPADEGDLRRNVDEATAEQRWVVDGNYVHLRDLTWRRADTLIWLNYSFFTVFGRALWRTVSRVVWRTRIYSGNRESFRLSFMSRDSILLWVIKSYSTRRLEIPALLAEPKFADLQVLEFKTPGQARRFLRGTFATAGPRRANQ